MDKDISAFVTKATSIQLTKDELEGFKKKLIMSAHAKVKKVKNLKKTLSSSDTLTVKTKKNKIQNK